jgi:DNA adenine methylase
MMSMPEKPRLFMEPFAGGAIVGLTIAFEQFSKHVHFIELDDQVASVWRTILGNHGAWLAERITNFDLTFENAAQVIDSTPRSLREKAFQTILRNRIYHGGILAKGSGMLKHGENGKGIHSRWYPATLHRRISAIVKLRRRISFTEEDGLDALERYEKQSDCVYFIDPPYTAGGKRAGRRLYRFCDIDHERLFEIVASLHGDFLMTYDDAPEVRYLAEKHGMQTELVAMSNTHHAKMTELLIGRDLSWLSNLTRVSRT